MTCDTLQKYIIIVIKKMTDCLKFNETVTFSVSVQRDIQWCKYPSVQRLKPPTKLQPANRPPELKQAQGIYCRYGHMHGSVHDILPPFVWWVFLHWQRNRDVIRLI